MRSGEPYLVSFAAVGNGSLSVVVERPKSDAYLAAAELRKRSVRAATVIIVVAVVLSILLSRALTVRLLALSAAAKRLEQGDLNVQVDCRTSHDELGDLGRTFNMAAKGLKEREQQLKDTYEELIQSEKLASIGRMSAGIVHEIKNPLTAILTYAELASMEVPEGDRLAKRLQTIASETMRCKDILDGLLSMSRKKVSDLVPVALHEVIRKVTEVTAAQLRVSRVELKLSLQAQDDTIVGDDNQLSQVFMNLVLNAIDAMENSDIKRLTVASEKADNERIVVRIRDTGHGMPRAVQERVFDPFFTTKGSGKGTGLGLSVTYGIMSEHSGHIRVVSEPDQGTEFILSFPLAPAGRRQPQAAAASS
jgi:signal transduction histidine kinase